jgi:tetratricopeptide (TPR) repeat protein
MTLMFTIGMYKMSDAKFGPNKINVYSCLKNDSLIPFQLILDLSLQLFPHKYYKLVQKVYTPFCPLENADDWINLESLGNIVPLKARKLLLEMSEDLANKESAPIHLHLGIEGELFSLDNLYSLLMLRDFCSSIVFHVYAKQEAMPSFIDFFPQQEVSWHQISDFPHHELSTSHKSIQIKRLIDLPKLNNCYQKVGYAWTLLKAGASELAITLLKCALNEESKAMGDHAQLLMHLQIIRFHAHEYVALAEQEYPDEFEGLDEKCCNYVYFLKAYGATLSRKLEIASEGFKKAGVHSDLPLVDEFSLYQLNIFALFQVLSKNQDTAMKLEHLIEEYIDKHNVKSMGLCYVNAMNIARLHKMRKDFQLSLSYYDKAYRVISGGGYSSSDFIYYHMNLASLAESSSDQEKAFVHWVQAAMHWLACDNPWALAWRPKLILCKEKTSELNNPLSLKSVSDFFINKLNEFKQQNSCDLDADIPPFGFATLDKHEGRANLHANTTLHVFSSNASVKCIREEQVQLAQHLSQLLKNILALPENIKTLVVDNLSENTDHTQDKLSLMAWLYQCDSCWYENKTQACSDIEVSLSPLLATIEHENERTNLIFQRHFLNKSITDKAQIQLIKELQASDKIYRSFSQENLAPLRDLFINRVIMLNVHSSSVNKTHEHEELELNC